MPKTRFHREISHFPFFALLRDEVFGLWNVCLIPNECSVVSRHVFNEISFDWLDRRDGHCPRDDVRVFAKAKGKAG